MMLCPEALKPRRKSRIKPGLSSFVAHLRVHSVLFAMLACLCFTGVASGMQAEPVDGSADAIKNIQDRAAADQKLEPAIQDQIAGLLAAVQANKAAAQIAAKKASEAVKAANAAEQTARAFQRELDAVKSKPVQPVDPNAPMAPLDAEAKQLREQVAELKKELEGNEAESTRRIARRQNSRAQVEAIENRITETKAQIELVEGDSSLTGEATALKLQSDLQAAEAEKQLLDAQLARDEAEARESVLKKQYDLIEYSLNRQEDRLKQLESVLATKRQKVAEQLASTAVKKEMEIQEAAAPLSFLAASYAINTELAKRNQALEQNSLQVKQEADKLKQSVESLEKKFVETNARVTNIGLTGSVGAMLRTRKAELAQSSAQQPAILDMALSIEELQYDIFDIDQREKDLSPDRIRSEIVEVFGEQDDTVWTQLEPPVAALIEARLNILKATRASLTRYSENLLDIQGSTEEKAATIKRFREYINERILWIQSNNLLFSELEIDASDQIAFSGQAWIGAGKELFQSLFSRPLLVGLGALLMVLLMFGKPRLRGEIDRLGEVAARGSCETFWPTARAFLMSMMVAVSLPLIPLVIGQAMLHTPAGGSTLFVAIGRSLVAAALFALPFEVLRQICRSEGLGQRHFEWAPSTVSKLKKNVDWVVLPGAVFVFAASLLLNLDLSHRIDLLERVVFIAGMLFATYFLHRTVNRKSGVFSVYLRANEKSWANQTSVLWIGIILGVPLALAVLAIWGYYYTALKLAECAYLTFVLAVAIETFRALARRLVLVRQRRSFIQAARRKRQVQIEAQQAAQKERAKARKAAAERGETLPEESTPTPIKTFDVLTEMQPDEIAGNVIQAHKLISFILILVWGVGMWITWTDVLPALKELDNYTVWSSHSVENGFQGDYAESEAGNGTSASITPVAPLPTGAGAESKAASVKSGHKRVTIRDLLLFFMLTAVTFILARNLPSAIEILFLEALPVDRSFRYAIKAITSYAIVLIGVVLAFRSLSISWSSVQWLATALTFGLAFGLQEIFANFVAGIILMFERPMRIGDLITVDDFTGHVTKIRTRATTIVNWDRKEYVIPNKDFITGRLVNWTLSDAINRIEFVVGVAYGTDVEKAKSIIYDICKKHSKVVDEPPSQVIFSEFGDSTLNLTVRVFIGEVDSRPVVIDSLHTLVNKAFNEAGIEIAFPQRDLHLRSIDAQASDMVQGLQHKEA